MKIETLTVTKGYFISLTSSLMTTYQEVIQLIKVGNRENVCN